MIKEVLHAHEDRLCRFWNLCWNQSHFPLKACLVKHWAEPPALFLFYIIAPVMYMLPGVGRVPMDSPFLSLLIEKHLKETLKHKIQHFGIWFGRQPERISRKWVWKERTAASISKAARVVPTQYPAFVRDEVPFTFPSSSVSKPTRCRRDASWYVGRWQLLHQQLGEIITPSNFWHVYDHTHIQRTHTHTHRYTTH